MAVRETVRLGMPVFNLGDRQKNRESHGNVISYQWNETKLRKVKK